MGGVVCFRMRCSQTLLYHKDQEGTSLDLHFSAILYYGSEDSSYKKAV